MTGLHDLLDYHLEYDWRDYPDMCDAHIYKAWWPNGEELTDEELDDINERFVDEIGEEARMRAIGAH